MEYHLHRATTISASQDFLLHLSPLRKVAGLLADWLAGWLISPQAAVKVYPEDGFCLDTLTWCYTERQKD